jgi:hypothetical protein
LPILSGIVRAFRRGKDTFLDGETYLGISDEARAQVTQQRGMSNYSNNGTRGRVQFSA